MNITIRVMDIIIRQAFFLCTFYDFSRFWYFWKTGFLHFQNWVFVFSELGFCILRTEFLEYNWVLAKFAKLDFKNLPKTTRKGSICSIYFNFEAIRLICVIKGKKLQKPGKYLNNSDKKIADPSSKFLKIWVLPFSELGFWKITGFLQNLPNWVFENRELGFWVLHKKSLTWYQGLQKYF